MLQITASVSVHLQGYLYRPTTIYKESSNEQRSLLPAPHFLSPSLQVQHLSGSERLHIQKYSETLGGDGDDEEDDDNEI